LILSALEKSKGNKTKAAHLLGITRRRLYSMIERFGL
jgi:transcriptional regulator with PAS, ATPase and Fis domain